VLSGGGGIDGLVGLGGNDTLDGGSGADYMVGGQGDDIYMVDNPGDSVVEAIGEGSDQVYTSVSYNLAAGTSVEVLSTNVASATTAINLTGNELDQALLGNAGANILNGGGGIDSMAGGAGNDIYIVDNAADSIVEAPGGGTDQVYTSTSYALAVGVSAEVLSVTDYAPTMAIDLTGNELGQQLFGNAGANVLNGGGGIDALFGFGGADTFAFTTTLGAGNVDYIADFVGGTDKVALDDGIFTAISGLGALDPNAFFAGSAAHDADDRIIYDQVSGKLYYDADGNGAGAAVQFAILMTHPVIAASDFVVI
jgi:serralysin